MFCLMKICVKKKPIQKKASGDCLQRSGGNKKKMKIMLEAIYDLPVLAETPRPLRQAKGICRVAFYFLPPTEFKLFTAFYKN
jgi:hypothetical protein